MTRVLTEFTTVLEEMEGDGIFIGTNVNVKSGIRHSRTTDERDKKMEEFVAQNGLQIKNQKKIYTCPKDHENTITQLLHPKDAGTQKSRNGPPWTM